MLARLAHPHHLSLAAPLVFLLGVPTILITRGVFHATRPEYFISTIPTISKSAAFAPASHVFLVGMLAVSACIFVTWAMIHRLHRERGEPLAEAEARTPRRLSAVAAWLGWLAGLSLALLAIVTLEVLDPLHILLSYTFFASQIAAYIADVVARRALNRRLAAAGRSVHRGRGQIALCLATTLLGLFYLFLFLSREKGFYDSEILAQGIYVTVEYVLATLCFAYAALYYPEFRRHFAHALETRR